MPSSYERPALSKAGAGVDSAEGKRYTPITLILLISSHEERFCACK